MVFAGAVRDLRVRAGDAVGDLGPFDAVADLGLRVAPAGRVRRSRPGVPSVQLRMTLPRVNERTGASGSARATWTVTGRIMSISSWLRMWQWKTYSQPKFTTWLTIGSIGLPLASVLLKPASVPFGPFGIPWRRSASSG